MGSAPLTHELALTFLEIPEIRDNFYFCGDVDSYYEYENGRYQLVKKKVFEKQLLAHIVATAPTRSVTPALIEQVDALVKILISNQISSILSPYVALNDCLYDFENFEFTDFDKAKPAFLTFPFSKQQILETKTPNFDRYLKTTFTRGENHEPFTELYPFVQEMLGYYLMPQSLGTCFFFVGTGQNGKSKLAENVLLRLIGRDHSAAMTITELTTGRFSLPNLVGKFVNICNEEESKYMRSDRFKALVTGEFITAEKKYGAHFEFKPHTKFLFCTNEMPTFDGMNYGLRRRVKILPFNRRFTMEERDPKLGAKLEAEAAGILAYAFIGAERYVENNETFSDKVKVLEDAMEELEKSSSSSIYYVKTFYEKSEKHWLPASDLYQLYRSWCETNGKKPVNSIQFGRDIAEALQIASKSKWVEGSVQRAWPLQNKVDSDAESYVAPPENPF